MKQVCGLFILGSMLYTTYVSGTQNEPNYSTFIKALDLYEHKIDWPESNNEIDLIDEFLWEIAQIKRSKIRSTLEKADMDPDMVEFQNHLVKANAILHAFSPKVRRFFMDREIVVKIADDAWEINRDLKKIKNIPGSCDEVLRELCKEADIDYDSVAAGNLPPVPYE